MNEPIRIVSTWLADATNGVNAVLAALTIDAGDVRPTVTVITDATSNEDVARGSAPTILSGQGALSVSYDGSADSTPNSTGANNNGTCDLLVRYDGRHSSAAAAQIAAGYVLRAAYISLNRLWKKDAARQRNGVELIGPNSMSIIPVVPRLETDPVLCGLKMQCEFFDTTS